MGHALETTACKSHYFPLHWDRINSKRIYWLCHFACKPKTLRENYNGSFDQQVWGETNHIYSWRWNTHSNLVQFVLSVEQIRKNEGIGKSQACRFFAASGSKGSLWGTRRSSHGMTGNYSMLCIHSQFLCSIQNAAVYLMVVLTLSFGLAHSFCFTA